MASNGRDHDIDLEDPKVEEAVFGREVEDFVENDRIGQYIVRRAKERILEAQAELLKVDPTNADEVRRWQNHAAVADMVRAFLEEAIRDGRSLAAVRATSRTGASSGWRRAACASRRPTYARAARGCTATTRRPSPTRQRA